jgi:hypothetical protein
MRAPTGVLSRTGVAVLLALGSIAGLAACSDDDPKPGHVQSPTSASTTSSPSPTTPEALIEAAVRAYYAELTQATRTQDTSRLAKMTTKGCPCFGAVRSIERGQRKGLSAPNASWTVDAVTVHDVEGSTGSADVKYTVSAYKVFDSDHRVVARYPETSRHLDLSLVEQGSNWIIGNLFDLES